VSTEGGKAKAVQAHVCTALLKCTPHTMDDKLQVHTHVQTGHAHTHVQAGDMLPRLRQHHYDLVRLRCPESFGLSVILCVCQQLVVLRVMECLLPDHHTATVRPQPSPLILGI
jgi:hypothetical protein